MSEYKELKSVIVRAPNFGNNPREEEIYQYRSVSSALTILKSDCFWATNARFSNDQEEQRFISRVLELPLKQRGIIVDPSAINDNYIVCFSEDRDMLGQWRGYSPDGGLSLGFDFSGPVPFTIRAASDAGGSDVKLYAQAEQVIYLHSRKSQQSEEDYYEQCFDQMKFVPGLAPENEDIFNLKNELIRKAPYIKHEGFMEENEWRLVFSNTTGEISHCIRYKKREESPIEIPYIVVSAGLPEREKGSCVVRLNIKKPRTDIHNLLQELREELAGCEVQTCWPSQEAGDLHDSFCLGCTQRVWADGTGNDECCRWNYAESEEAEYDLGTDSNSNKIIISQGSNQKEIYEKVYRIIQQRENCNLSGSQKPVKIWCEGHLPVRSITIGPGRNQQNIFEYIQHFCQHTYWLRDVDIFLSNIPYRQSMV